MFWEPEETQERCVSLTFYKLNFLQKSHFQNKHFFSNKCDWRSKAIHVQFLISPVNRYGKETMCDVCEELCDGVFQAAQIMHPAHGDSTQMWRDKFTYPVCVEQCYLRFWMVTICICIKCKPAKSRTADQNRNTCQLQCVQGKTRAIQARLAYKLRGWPL